MRILAVCLAWMASPFWETKPPQDWSEDQLRQMLTDSPWARPEGFLASAEPMKLAEAEWRRRHIAKRLDAPETADVDYQEFVRANPGKHVILAVRVDAQMDFSLAEEIRQMEKGCTLRSGKNKVKLVGHFPPNSSDPYLRLVFPRVELGKNLRLELYLPGITRPYRDLEFYTKEMTFRGRLEY